MRKYHPRHALMRAVRSLPKWARASILGVAASGSVAGLVIAALPAGAASGARYYSTAASGYKADGAQFRYVQATTYLRAAGKTRTQPFVEIQTDCGSSSAGPEVELIPQANGTWTANGDLGGMAGTVTPVTAAQPFTAGRYVTLSIYYSPTTGNTTFKVSNADGSNPYEATATTTPVSLKCAGIGDVDLTAYHGSYTPPTPAPQVSGRFTNVGLTSYSGHRAGLSSWWTRHKYLMVGSLNTDRPVEAMPSNLSHGNFSTTLEPAS